MRYVIVGAGPAGLTAAETIREHDRRAVVTLLSAEPYPPYSPPALIEFFRTGDDTSLFWKGRGVCERLAIDFRAEAPAHCIRPEAHELVLRNRMHLAYDRLIVATGSHLHSPVQGGDRPGVYDFKTLTAAATLIGAPLGIFAGTYMSEYGRYTRLTPAIRFINDVLLSAPSIVIGLFVYEIMVVPMGHFSAWSGIMALAIIVIPITLRTTEDMLALVPNQLREAAAALGAPAWMVIWRVSYRAALGGLLTGVLLAVARISGETAPLLFTALNNQFWSTNLGAPMASLPATIFQFAMSPYPDWQRLAWAGALLITLAVLLLNVFARLLAARQRER